jgi:hypothetical protein
MKYFIFLSVFTFLGFLSASGQKDLADLKAKLLAADSVILVGHETLSHEIWIDVNTGQRVPNPTLIEKGEINYKIVRQKIVLKDSAIRRLSKILAKPNTDRLVAIGLGFSPHHAVFIFKNGKFSFVHICFTCGTIETSEDIEIDSSDFNNRKWDELKAFFLQHGMKYKMEPEYDEDDE